MIHYFLSVPLDIISFLWYNYSTYETLFQIIFMKGMDQNMKKFLTLALIAAMMLSMIVVGTSAAAWDGTTVSESLKGEGTAEKPYLIETGADLAFLAKTVNEGEAYEGKYFTQTADIDLGNKEWTPIGEF